MQGMVCRRDDDTMVVVAAVCCVMNAPQMQESYEGMMCLCASLVVWLCEHLSMVFRVAMLVNFRVPAFVV